MASAQMQRLIRRFESALDLLRNHRCEHGTSIDAMDAHLDLMESPLQSVAKYRARSIDDLVAKAKIADWSGDGAFEERIVDSIVRDLLRMDAVK